ncbi:MAG: hypothetical protein HN704_08795 [Bacteroidetes bacterium]|jgi:hypothetical protein|nr:hypothetical protein [Bacteroidota bacterium]MBT6687511.1 hypothetical protein [Bacteroidota bacterium]MBT7142999.1 hypothetical protein [Bacteroidota bacterium]MBT7491689.1 hypothetical protein [Bacteroidota bacterium]
MNSLNGTNSGQTFGIIGFIFAVLAFIFAFIPCIGIIAILPGIFAIIFSALGLVQANKSNSPKGLIIAALVISIVSVIVASIWGLFFIRVANERDFIIQHENVNFKKEDLGNIDELDELAKNLEDKLDSIDLDEINITIDGNKLTMEEKEKLKESAKKATNEIKNSVKEFVKDVQEIDEKKNE